METPPLRFSEAQLSLIVQQKRFTQIVLLFVSVKPIDLSFTTITVELQVV